MLHGDGEEQERELYAHMGVVEREFVENGSAEIAAFINELVNRKGEDGEPICPGYHEQKDYIEILLREVAIKLGLDPVEVSKSSLDKL